MKLRIFKILLALIFGFSISSVKNETIKLRLSKTCVESSLIKETEPSFMKCLLMCQRVECSSVKYNVKGCEILNARPNLITNVTIPGLNITYFFSTRL